MKSKKKPKRKQLVKKLDQLWSDHIKAIGVCQRCGSVKNLQAAHIFSRSNYPTRWMKENGICLCAGCHIFWAHKNPVEFTELVKLKLGENVYNDLRNRAKTVYKVSNSTLCELVKYFDAT